MKKGFDCGEFTITSGCSTVTYDEVLMQTHRATLFLIAGKEYLLTLKFTKIDPETKQVYMAKWYYDKFFI